MASIKTIHVKINKPSHNPIATPTARICFTDRSSLIQSPSFTTNFTDKKPTSIELTKLQEGRKKCIKVKRKKAESLDIINRKHNQKDMLQSNSIQIQRNSNMGGISRVGSEKQIGKKKSNLSLK